LRVTTCGLDAKGIGRLAAQITALTTFLATNNAKTYKTRNKATPQTFGTLCAQKADRLKRRVITKTQQSKPVEKTSDRLSALQRANALETLKPSNQSTLLGDPFAQAAGPPPIPGGRTGNKDHAPQTSPKPISMATGGEVDIEMDTSVHKQADSEGFRYPRNPCRPATPEPAKPTETKNKFQSLATQSDVQPSTSAAPQATPAPQAPKKKRVPPIYVKLPRIEGAMIAQLKAAAPSCYFEYVATGLRVQTKTLVEHAATTQLLNHQKIEYFTYDPNPGTTIKYVLRGLPPNTSCEEIATALRQQNVAISQVKQMTKARVDQETREKTLTPLPLWIVTIQKTPENMQKLKSLTGILFFKIKIEDLKTKKKEIQCFRCQKYGHKADFCQLKQKCVKCGGDHWARECPQSPSTKATCANCQGEHPANYKNCPAAIKYKQRKAPRETVTATVNINSTAEFPSLPNRPEPPQAASTTTPVVDSDASGLKEILHLLTSGTIKTYLTKFKGLMASVKAQADPISRMMAFFEGLMNIFQD